MVTIIFYTLYYLLHIEYGVFIVYFVSLRHQFYVFEKWFNVEQVIVIKLSRPNVHRYLGKKGEFD